MTQQEMKKLRVIDQTIAKNITVKEAAGLLDLSERQVFRLKKGVKKHGAAFIIHKNRGRKPAHAIQDETKNQIIALKKMKKYSEANFIHCKELLSDLNQSRYCEPQEGLMLQPDASPF
ncbi:MAG: helix-turn-helix domain-containing protein [Firmicutes bacterium]|nr:helix-turn-helix domain-containing protein [Bacillota bacterium]